MISSLGPVLGVKESPGGGGAREVFLSTSWRLGNVSRPQHQWTLYAYLRSRIIFHRH